LKSGAIEVGERPVFGELLLKRWSKDNMVMERQIRSAVGIQPQANPITFAYWFGGLGGSGAFIVLGGAGNVPGPLGGFGVANCGLSFLSLTLSGIKGLKPNNAMRRRSSFS
jgi:hypothetical protein